MEYKMHNSLTDIGDGFIDVAVANLDGGTERDIYGLDEINEIWRFDLDTSHLVFEVTDGVPTAIAATQNSAFGFGDAVYYGTDDGQIRQLGDSTFSAEVSKLIR